MMVGEANLERTREGAAKPRGAYNSRMISRDFLKWRACAGLCNLQNSGFSSLIAAGDVWRGGTSATRRQKFHTNDVNQCLYNKPFSSCFSPRTIRNGKKRYPRAPRKESPPPMCSTLYSQLLLLTLGTTSKYVYVRRYV